MEHVKKEEAVVIPNSPACLAIAYSIADKEISAAVIELTGRYPETGWGCNLKCKLMGYILKGSGRLTTENRSVELSEGDLVLIDTTEKYYWEGSMTILMPSTPAWHPEQYQYIVS